MNENKENVNNLMSVWNRTDYEVIKSNLIFVKSIWEKIAEDAENVICTESNVKDIKKMRADISKIFLDMEEQRKRTKEIIMSEWNSVEDVYKDCVSTLYKRAKELYDKKISLVEGEIKQECEEELREYFDQICAANGIDWLEYERAGIVIDMASARSKTRKSMKDKIKKFVEKVKSDVTDIMYVENSEEVMFEYKRSLDAVSAMLMVMKRHKEIENLRGECNKKCKFILTSPKCEFEGYVECKTIDVQLVLHPTVKQFEDKIKPLMEKIKKICDMEGIMYE